MRLQSIKLAPETARGIKLKSGDAITRIFSYDGTIDVAIVSENSKHGKSVNLQKWDTVLFYNDIDVDILDDYKKSYRVGLYCTKNDYTTYKEDIVFHVVDAFISKSQKSYKVLS